MEMAVAEDLDRYEATLRAHGFGRIAGVDEVGRGALAGPLVAAAVVLPEGFDRAGLRDSKLLTAKQREQQCARIVAGCTYVIRKIEPSVLDLRGLHRSNLALLRRCVRALEPTPDYVLTDGFPVSKMPCPSLGVKKGDMVAASIAAASIVAKVTRDRIMRGPIHRLSFAGVGQPELPGLDGAAPGWP
jgi:ribonuclease HII